MKKIYFSLMTIAALLFTACNNDEGPGNVENTGAALVTTITFDSGINEEVPVPKATAISNAIPVTTWANVKQLQLFLYNASDGTVAYSAIIEASDIPSGTTPTKQFTWTNVPTGTYRLALVANALSTTDKVDTWVNASKQAFTPANVLTHKFQSIYAAPAANTGLQIDLKQEGTLQNVGDWAAGLTNYAIPSEIFTAYSESVQINTGLITTVSGTLALEREVSMLRTRFNIKGIEKLQTDVYGTTAKALFDNGANNFIAVRRLPVGFGLKVGSFAGGVFDTSSNNRVMMVSSGAGTFKDQNPVSGYNPNVILNSTTDPNFTLWHDVMVLPNASATQITTPEDPLQPKNAFSDRKYWIIVCARAEAGYKFDDGTVAADGDPIYWGGTINERFEKNTIQEVNIAFLTTGTPEVPNPRDEGTLNITVGLPQNWVLATESVEVEF